MALISAKLANGLANLVPVGTEAQGIANWVAAWDAYFSGASVNGVPANRVVYQPALQAMKGAMVGMNAPGAGAAKIQQGVATFWQTIAPLGTALWVLAPAVITPPLSPPPGIGGISSSLQSVFDSNTRNPNATLASCAQAVANVLHTAGGLGGIAIVQPPPIAPPIPTPIL
jgi:acetyl-CoA carboxylase beta subunit